MSDEDLLQQVRLVWAEVLDLESVDSVPLDTNFLDAGGNSLLLVMLAEQLCEQTGQPVKMTDLFHHGTVRAQAALLAAGADKQHELTAIGTRDRRQLLGRARRSQPTPSGQEIPAAADTD